MKKIGLLISFLFVLTGLKIFAQPAPAVTIEAYDILGNPLSNTPTICQFQSIDFNVHIPYENTEPKTFKWKKNGVVVLTQTAVSPAPPTISWNSTTLATGDAISLTVVFTNPPPFYSPDSATSQNIIFTVTPNQPPSVNVTSNAPNDTICYGSPITFTANIFDAGSPSYQWYLDFAPVSTSSIYNTLSTLLPGSHCVYCEVTSNQFCDLQDPVYNPVATSSQFCFVVEICTSVQQNIMSNGISIYPNPAKNELIIDNGRWTISNIEIYNTLGEKIIDQKQAKNQKQIAIDVSSLRSGIYFIKIRGENAERITKFVKQ